MLLFDSARNAKEFLVEKIVEESTREGITLSDIETKMLYFTETGWTLPDIAAVSEAFDLQYDQAEYEAKISGLVWEFRRYARQHSTADLKLWNEAVRVLRKEDHYLLVMVNMASSKSNVTRMPQSGGNRLAKLILMGGVGFIVCAVVLMIYMWQQSQR